MMSFMTHCCLIAQKVVIRFLFAAGKSQIYINVWSASSLERAGRLGSTGAFLSGVCVFPLGVPVSPHCPKRQIKLTGYTKLPHRCEYECARLFVSVLAS